MDLSYLLSFKNAVSSGGGSQCDMDPELYGRLLSTPTSDRRDGNSNLDGEMFVTQIINNGRRGEWGLFLLPLFMSVQSQYWFVVRCVVGSSSRIVGL